jgi:glycosyltransferase involved in cell wall biosynthesis
MARVLTRARCIAGFRGAVNYKKRHWETPFLRIAVRLAHVVTVNSPSLKPLASEWGADDRRLRLLPNGVDLPSTQADVTPTPPTAVVVANYRWYKGHATLIEALGSVKSDVVVRLCGEGDERPGLEDQVSRRGLDGRVVFVEPPADVAGELERAQFAIHPSHQEGLPNAVLEELSFGLPVVATNVGGTSLLVEDGVTGRLVPPNDHEALASAIDDLAGNATHRKSMAVDARLRAERFGWPECVRRYVALFDELLGVDP